MEPRLNTYPLKSLARTEPNRFSLTGQSSTPIPGTMIRPTSSAQMHAASVCKQGPFETRPRHTSLRIAAPLHRARDPYPTTAQHSDAKHPQDS